MSEDQPYGGRAHVAIEDHNGSDLVVVDSTLAHPAAIRLVRGELGHLLTAESASALAGVLDRFAGTGTVAPEPAGGRRELVAGLIRLHDMTTGDTPADTAIRYAISCALDAATGLGRTPVGLDDGGLATYGEPSKRRTVWILRYLDAEVGDMVWDSDLHGETQAETLARAAYHSAIGNWNCTLFRTASLLPDGLRSARLRSLLDDAMDAASASQRYGVSAAAARISEAARDDARMAPVYSACRASIAREIAQWRQKLAGLRDMVDLHRRAAARSTDADRLRSEERLEELAFDIPAAERRITQLEASAAAMRDDPEGCFLPIGTVVEVREIEEESIHPVPVAGSRGVVVGYGVRSDRCNLVAMLDGTRAADGSVYSLKDLDDDPDCPEYRPAKFNYRRDELDPVADGVLVGRGANRTVGFVPTHVDREDDGEENMLVESGGFTWRVQMINHAPENTQIHHSTPYFLGWLEPMGESR